MIALCIYLLLEFPFTIQENISLKMSASVNRGLIFSIKPSNSPTIVPNVLAPENSPTSQPDEEHKKNDTMNLWSCQDGSCDEWEKYFEKYFKLTRENFHIFLLFLLLGALIGFCMAQFLGHSDL